VATVDDACALRAANKGYRRAVDTTVRRLVYEDQPAVRTSREVTLRIHRDTANLDAARIAFTCDAFKKIARLVVVAFALDGAKDELHEGEECGERRPARAASQLRVCDSFRRQRNAHGCRSDGWAGLRFS
jgi:hypothetical protein